jgi:hypothetical protein
MDNIKVNIDALKPRREFKRHQIQPGHNIYRILPAFGSQEVHNNYPFKRWTLAWLNDPTTGRRKPFALPPFEKGNPDPISEYTKLLSEKIEKAKVSAVQALVDKGVSQETAEETIRKKLADVSKLVWEMRPKSSFFYNACNKAGEVGILELKKTAHDALKKSMYEYIKDYSQDPTSLNSQPDDSGVWFNVERIGEKGDKNTEYTVSKNQSKRKNERGVLTFEDDREALSEHVAANYENLGYDIYNLYQTYSHDDLYTILMYNLRPIVESMPFARIEGFDPDKFVFASQTSEPAEEPVAALVDLEVKAMTPKKPVTVALAESDDDLGVDLSAIPPAPKPAPAVKTTAAPAPKKEPEIDIMALADGFLNS